MVFDLILFGFLGLALGSFTSALIPRVLCGQSWGFVQKAGGEGHVKLSRSSCPSCEHILGVLDLIPVFSWVSLRGKCRYCAHPISVFYPLCELSFLLLALPIYYLFGATLLGVVILFMAPFVVAQVFLCVKHRRWSKELLVILAVFMLGVISLVIIT